MTAGIFSTTPATAPTTTPTHHNCSGIDGWWRCLSDTAQAIIIAALLLAAALIIVALITRRSSRT